MVGSIIAINRYFATQVLDYFPEIMSPVVYVLLLKMISLTDLFSIEKSVPEIQNNNKDNNFATVRP